ncbi:helix-turn-helix protein [Stackebrandtia albiflava]|uniref:Helix-turn-helix protein n=1 Tax=Stackebrandtia albiflava TaxID=406432 RepID=A0A562UXV8_9ACTN|nr:ArsR family transcriptional regulator [Stackebrandtia albiflava]TWJ10480.1 helix-turn-helix protein [Stackebrandtia albiflava]
MSSEQDDQNEIRYSDPEMIRALAHPARVAVLDYLSDAGEATATECAKVAGLSPSAMSYHLRTLAKVGLVEDAEGRGDGRERVWRRKVGGFSVGVEYDAPESEKLVGRAMIEAFQADSDAKMRRWLDAASEEPREWYDTMTFSQVSLKLTVEEVEEFKKGLMALMEPFGGRARPEAPEGARRMAFHFRLFPEV